MLVMTSSAKKTYRIGLLGAGFMGRTHTYCWRVMEQFYGGCGFHVELGAVCTSNEKSARAACEALGFKRWHTDTAALVNDPAVDIIDIASPNRFHYEALSAALACGKPVYCDKPLTGNLAQAEALAREAADLDRAGQMTLQYRFFPATMRARTLVAEGRLGDIHAFRAVYLHSGNMADAKPLTFKDMRSEGGGVLYDMGSHVIDLVSWICGSGIAGGFAAQKILNPRRPRGSDMALQDGDDMTAAVVRLENGALGTIEASKIATGALDDLRFEIHGTQGGLRFSLMEPNYLEYFDASAPDAPLGGTAGFTRIQCGGKFDSPLLFPSPKNSIGWLAGHLHCAYTFMTALHQQKPFDPSLRRGLMLERVLDALQKSAETAGPFSL